MSDLACCSRQAVSPPTPGPPNEQDNSKQTPGFPVVPTGPPVPFSQSAFGMHDRDQFEVFLYALNPDDGSPERRRMEGDVEHFRDLSALTARDAAATIANDG